MHHPFKTHEKEKVRSMYMHENDLESNIRGVELPEVYSLVKITGEDDKKRPIAAQELKNEQANDSYSLQASSTVEPPGSTYNYDRKGFLT